MIWDKVAWGYDLFETLLNGRVYKETGRLVAEELKGSDTVLECACGTGSITRYAAPACKRLIACDRSVKMMDEARRNCRDFGNVRFFTADMTRLPVDEGRFDKVIAGNVIHLLPDPEAAVRELMRVCKPGGKLIIPTYVDMVPGSHKLLYGGLELIGIHFNRDFTLAEYKQFFADMGFTNAEYKIADGRVPCAVAVITI